MYITILSLFFFVRFLLYVVYVFALCSPYLEDNKVSIYPSLEYLARSCCSKHALHDKREQGVFKTEFIGDEMIGLCSKTYFVENRELQISKLSCKGAN